MAEKVGDLRSLITRYFIHFVKYRDSYTLELNFFPHIGPHGHGCLILIFSVLKVSQSLLPLQQRNSRYGLPLLHTLRRMSKGTPDSPILFHSFVKFISGGRNKICFPLIITVIVVFSNITSPLNTSINRCFTPNHDTTFTPSFICETYFIFKFFSSIHISIVVQLFHIRPYTFLLTSFLHYLCNNLYHILYLFLCIPLTLCISYLCMSEVTVCKYY